MNYNRAIVVANNTSEGISVIDIHICDDSGRVLIHSAKRLIDEINALTLLDKTKIKTIIARKYGVSLNNVIFK